VNAAASVRGGRMWGKAYSICPSGIFVAPESGYQRPEDLANVSVGVVTTPAATTRPSMAGAVPGAATARTELHRAAV
jgi:hypothetical protein